MATTEHPLAMELATLRAAVTRFQDEAHGASVKLQRFSLDTSNAHDRILRLERENSMLNTEIGVLRRHTPADAQEKQQSSQVQELSLALRKLSDKLDLTENALQDKNTELVAVQGELDKAMGTVEEAYALAARVRGREEEGLIREKMLEREIQQIGEQAKLADIAVREYANLVRSLEGRASGTDDPVSSLAEGRAALDKLFADFSQQATQYDAEIARLTHELEAERGQRESDLKTCEKLHQEIGRLRTELQKMEVDDNTATKMVSRYMKFSQTSTNALQESLLSLKARHFATVETLSSQISALSSQLRASQSTVERMRLALDELGGDLMREAFGRRRETALRIRLVSREEAFEEWLQHWVRRAEESGDLPTMLAEAKALDISSIHGSEGRITAAESALETLLDDLRTQTEKRLQLEKLVVDPPPESPPSSTNRVPSAASSSLTLAVSEMLSTSTDGEQPQEVIKVIPPAPSLKINDVPPISPPTSLETVIPSPPESKQEASTPVEPPIFVPPATPAPLSPTISPAPEFSAAPARRMSISNVSPVNAELLTGLEAVGQRYVSLQRAFKNCHLALQDLKQEVQCADPVLQTATERLIDYTEDARVELEIRIADEALQTQGFQTLLTLGSATAEVQQQALAFVSGEDPMVRRAQKSLEGKLEDVEHDTACVRRAVREPELLAPQPSPPPRSTSPSPTFGSVMTTRKLRHSGSMNFGKDKVQDPYKNLGLRVSMPQQRQPTVVQPPASPAQGRSRTLSTMYALGLGGARSVGRLVSTPSQSLLSKPAETEDDVE
ncbi:hypothetical protein CYLTODRAFT_486548 [Cylindrobasidium torrendii FP15055 ss-10]|uniref:Uncharacterized protein n=1 Tax=Cylindrobasidium torrendii FP15055 ss-10 TaxID=1314674 RepID=A0A0D7BNK6_9AGAR|nr:hypothetical protein CYLTODRAFT_486548 [Cylindrobasidium torrendii FP15055 ss-10]